MRKLTLSFVLAVACMTSPAANACSTSSGPSALHLIELYTSEGCDSCPPADRWMSSLLAHKELVGLEFHVDYWNTQGWRDPFSERRFSMRQRMLSERANDVPIYTPQIWVDGRIWRDWPRHAPKLQATDPAPVLKMQAKLDDPLRVRVAASFINKTPEHAGIYVALTENGLSRDVRGGENRGRILHHDEVVRAFTGPIDLSGGVVKIEQPLKMDVTKSSLVAFVQDSRSGDVLQVVRLPLATCEARP